MSDYETEEQVECADDEPRFYSMIPHFILSIPELTHTALRLYLHYRKMCGQDHKGSCWMSLKTLSEQCFMTRQTVVNARNKLKDLELITVKTKIMPNGSKKITIKVVNSWKRNNEFHASTKRVLAEHSSSTKRVLGQSKKSTEPSTKQVPGSVRNEYSNKINNTNNMKQEKDELKKNTPACSQEKGFDFESDEESTINEESSFADKASNKLYNSLMEKRKIMRKNTNLKKWSCTIDTFINESIVTIDEFTEVLDWYVVHLGERYIPQAYSAQTFCDKFVKIIDAMGFEKEKNKSKSQIRMEEMERRFKKSGLL